jgi:hypothetical protein
MRNDRSIRSSRIGLGIAALALATAGCGAVTEQVTERVIENAIEQEGGGKVDIDRSDGQMTMETQDGTMVIGGGDIPPGITDLFDLPRDFVVESTMTATGDGAGSFVFGRTTGDLQEVVDGFREDLEGAGWTIDSTFTAGDTVSLGASKDDRTTTVSVSLDTTTDELIVQIILG